MSSIPNVMLAARYHLGGEIKIEELPTPSCPPGGLLIKTIASGLCSGELMTWYMDRKAEKAPHVLGHEVCGTVVESENEAFPVGSLVSPHHHAPCLNCDYCRRGAFVHCTQWKSTRLDPGGMAEYFAVAAKNLTDCHLVDHLLPQDAALMEPLACVAKQLRKVSYQPGEPAAVIGLGVMGLLHAQMMPGCVAFETNPARREWAIRQGVDAREPDSSQKFSCVILCPGTKSALDFALEIADIESRIGLFSPLPPEPVALNLESLYMRDISLINSYSCGPNDTQTALDWIKEGRISANHVVTHKIELSELTEAYQDMKSGRILKPMVIFP